MVQVFWLASMSLAWSMCATELSLPHTSSNADDNADSAQIAEPIEVWGAVLPINAAELSSRLEGTIATIHVEEGDIVEPKAVLLQLESEELEARLALAEQELRKVSSMADDHSAVAAAQAQLAKVKATLDALQQLEHHTQLELFRTEMDVKEREAALSSAVAKATQDKLEVAIKREQYRLAQLQLDSTVITSPMSGVVGELLKSAGEMVRPGEPILKLTRMDQLYIRVELDMRSLPPQHVANYRAVASFSSPEADVTREQVVNLPITISNISATNLDSNCYHALGKLVNRKVQDRLGNWHWVIRPGMVGRVSFELEQDTSTPAIDPDKLISIHRE